MYQVKYPKDPNHPMNLDGIVCFWTKRQADQFIVGLDHKYPEGGWIQRSEIDDSDVDLAWLPKEDEEFVNEVLKWNEKQMDTEKPASE